MCVYKTVCERLCVWCLSAAPVSGRYQGADPKCLSGGGCHTHLSHGKSNAADRCNLIVCVCVCVCEDVFGGSENLQEVA